MERPKICKASRIISAGSQSECGATLETHAELHTTQICQKKILFHPFFLIFLGNYRLHEAQPGQKVFAASDVRGNDAKPTGAPRTFLLSNIMPPKLCNLCFEPIIFMHLCKTHCQRMHMPVEHFYMLFCTHQVVTCLGRRRKTSAPPSPLAGTNRVMERHRHLRAAAVTDTSMLIQSVVSLVAASIQSVVSLVAAPSPQQICKRPRCQFSAARLRSHNIAHNMKIKPFGSAK